MGQSIRIGKDGTREDVEDKYHSWILTQKHIIVSLSELKDKVLGFRAMDQPSLHTHLYLKVFLFFLSENSPQSLKRNAKLQYGSVRKFGVE